MDKRTITGFVIACVILSITVGYFIYDVRVDIMNEKIAATRPEDNIIEDTQVISLLAETATIVESGEKTHLICLPPSYTHKKQRYPVVYCLHGFTSGPTVYQSYFEEAFNRMKTGIMKEVILVAVDHTNSLNGSFMLDSPVSGHWETAFMRDIISHIDDHYRTIASKEGRGIFGHSMGGFAAINFGMNYPESFNAVYAYAPNIIRDEDFEDFYNSTFMLTKALGTTFAPKLDEKPYYKIPRFDGTSEDDEIISLWLDGLGHLEEKVERYALKDQQLEMIAFENGSQDSFIYFEPGCLELARLLKEKSINHIHNLTDGPHSLSMEVVCDRGLPTVMEYLKD